MNTLLNKIQKASAVVELKSVEDLELHTPYIITKMGRVPTKYGSTVQVHLQELTNGQVIAGEDSFRVYLPARISEAISEEDVENYNASEIIYTMTYRGKVGKAFLIDFN
uniref:Sodium channel protein type 9 subunit alpha n=1 Tax=Lygus hesperus TaxID=30085 RepID=A0A0A9YUT7_LYGHE